MPEDGLIRAGRCRTFSDERIVPTLFFYITMPRGLRKRGRRQKNNEAEDFSHEKTQLDDGFELNHDEAETSQPSWIIPAANQSDAASNPEAPFGFVNTEVKAYFRTVDVQIRDWQDSQVESEGMDGNADIDPNEGAFDSI
jgi:nucleolar protein 9